MFGHVDLLLRVRGGGPFNLADPVDAASRFVIEPVDAPGIPVLADDITADSRAMPCVCRSQVTASRR